jgi:hypothetical protein
MDAVLRVVDRCRVVGVDDFDTDAVSNQDVVVVVCGHGTGEGAVYGVAGEEARAFVQVVRGSTTHDDRSEAEPEPVACMADQDTRQ